MASEELTLAYYPFFAGDWLSSTSIALMPAEVEGTYIRLLCHQWRHGHLPSLPKDMQSLTKLQSAAAWRLAWQHLERHFPPGIDGNRRNARLEVVRATALAKHAQQVEAGQRSATARARRRQVPTAEKPTGVLTLVATTVATESPTNTATNGQQSKAKAYLPKTLSDDSVKAPSVVPSADSLAASQRTAPPPDAVMLGQLRAAAQPHEAMALEVLLASAVAPYAVVGELWAVGAGDITLRGKRTGKRVEIQHVLRAIAEMAGNGAVWNITLFRAYARRIADRPPEALSEEQQAAARLATEIQRNSSITTEREYTLEECAELARKRVEAMAEFRRQMGRSDATDPALSWPQTYAAPDQAAVT